jgi:hypothetical protein
MAKIPKKYDDDDGRTIANMNVEGMPWYDKQQKRESRAQARAELAERVARGEMLTTRETFRYGLYAVLAGLTVVGFIAGGVCLIILILWLLWK